MLELTALKRSHQSARAPSSRHSSLGQSPPDSPLCSTPDSALSRGESTTALSTPVVPSLDAILEQQHALYQSPGTYSRGVSHSLPRTYKSSFSPLRHGRKRLRRSTSVTDLFEGSSPPPPPPPPRHQQENPHHHQPQPHHQQYHHPAHQRPPVSVAAVQAHHSHQHHQHHHHQQNLPPSQLTTSTQHHVIHKPKSQHHPLLTQKSLQLDDAIVSNHEIERIIAKIQQDNKILAELDKNAVCGSRFSTHPPKGHLPAPRRRTLPKKPTSSKYHLPKITIDHIDEPESSTSRDLSCIYEHHGMHLPTSSTTMQQLQGMGHMAQFQPIATMVPTNFFSVVPTGATTLFSHNQGPGSSQQHHQTHHHHHLQHSMGGLIQHHSLQQQQISIPTIITTAHHHVDHSKSVVVPHHAQILNGTKQQQMQLQQLQHQQNQILASKGADMLDIPGKGRCFVYIARYSYDPFHQSPNENPESELNVNAGDYVLIWGTMDEDGFLDGELLDGRRGLVPSNYVERLMGEDLVEFHQQVVLGIKESEDVMSTSLLDFDYHRNVGDESQRMIIEDLMHRRQEEFGYLDLEDIIDDDGDPEKQVPPPVQLTLERQLNKSILIGWNPPDCPPGTIDSYQVYVNGLLRCTIKANERTRALVEGVDCNRPHRISVRAVTPNRRTSRDAACTMIIGKNAPLAPSTVRATSVTSTSAVITWLPANSNYQHVVCVNNVEVRTVKPGVYRHTITGLTQNTTYRVTVRSKNIKAPHFDEKGSKQMEKLSAHTEFRTLPKGLPDPPIDVTIEPGPQDNTILVTWHPVAAATSNGAIVTGYAVFADGRKILEIDSPSGDHALLDLNRFQGAIPRQVTVRTKSRDSLSSDSVPIPIPAQVLRLKRHNVPNQNSLPLPQRPRARHPSMMEAEESYGSDRETSGFHVPGIGSLNIKNRLKTSFFTRSSDMPEVPKDTRQSNPREFRGRGGSGLPLPPQQMPPPPMGHGGRPGVPPSDRPRGYPPPVHPPHRGKPGAQGGDYYGGAGGGGGGGGGGRHPRPGPRPPPSDMRHRLFVALFDYDPPSMSPNPDACEEELPFREGQLIKIYGEKDPDGFYWGEAGGRQGFVPCNMVSEVQPDDERVAQELLIEGGDLQQQASGRDRRGMGRDRWGDIYASVPVKVMVALYDYDPQEISPNVDSEVELSFQTGDIIKVFGDMDDDGFFMGELNGMRGLVPSNFLTEAPPEYGADGRGQRRGGPSHLGPPGRRPPGMDPRHPGPAQGPGPGARGPPPPPREGGSLGRGGVPRKDASYPEHSERNSIDPAQARRGGGRGGGLPGQGRGRGANMNPAAANQYDAQRNSRGPPSNMSEYSPSMEPPGSLGASRGLFSGGGGGGGLSNNTTTTSMAPTGTTSANPITSKLPGVLTEAPGSLMQKFSDLTHNALGGGTSGAEGAEGGSMLSKGKDMLFKRFGL